MKPHRFVPPLTERQTKELRHVRDHHPSARTRDRAAAILLSAQGHTIGQLCQLFQRNRLTLSLWFDQWAEHGIGGLLEKPGRGKKRLFNDQEERQIQAWLQTHPHQIKPVLGMIEQHIGKTASVGTIRNIALRAKAA